MKILQTLLAFTSVIAFQSAFAQNAAHLKLADQYPAAGEKLTFTYNPSGTVVEGKPDVKGTIYFLDNKDNPAADLHMEKEGDVWKSTIAIPLNTKAFFIKLEADGKVDNNDDKGYLYMIYKHKQPVEGAYALSAYFVSSGMGSSLAKIKTNPEEGVALYKKEFDLHPQSEKEFQAMYYSLLARSPENAAIVRQKIAGLEVSGDEKDEMLATSLLRSLKLNKEADSLNAAIKAKFPNGAVVKNEMASTIIREKDVVKKDSLYAVFIKKYPESPDEKHPVQDNLRLSLISAYLKNGDLAAFHKYEGQVKNKLTMALYMNNTGYGWAQKGERLADAEKLSKQAVDIVNERIANPVGDAYSSPMQAKRNSEQAFNMFGDTYAYVLYKENKIDQALKYEQAVIDKSDQPNSGVVANYMQILNAAGQYAKAKEAGEKSIRTAQGSDVIKEELKKDYIKIKGSDSGYDQYLANLENIGKDKEKSDLAKTMINVQAPAFALKDIDGKVVSLKDLKGKIVVVDFWATWCGPCKSSFPGMQLAVNKYKNDPNVKFLFVDTWETADNYLDGVKKFIDENKYTFHVLLDEKTASGRQDKVVSSFDVSGIPTKFIIDKTGNIRFKYIGYSGSTEKVLNEVTSMIEMVNTLDMDAPGQKSSK